MRCDEAVSRDTAPPLRILVVGAGIAGLAMARALARAPHRVTLVERASRIRAEGAGLVMPSSMMGLLDRIDVDARAFGYPLRRLSIIGSDGVSRASMRGRIAFTRSQIVSAMAEGLDAVVDLRLATALESVRPSDSGVACEVAGREETFDLVIGADGMGSSVRAAIAPKAGIRASGQFCWRGIVDGVREADRATETWDGSDRIGIVPLDVAHSYIYVVRRLGESLETAGREDRWNGAEAWALAALSALPTADLLAHELRELERPIWGTGRIAVIGDAAHAMTPNLGLGAFLAVQDALVLAEEIARRGDPVRAYARRRAWRVGALQWASRMIGDLAHSPARTPQLARRLLAFE